MNREQYLKHIELVVNSPRNALQMIDRLQIGFKQYLRDTEKTGHWVWNPDGNDWGIGAWCCSECGCKNDNLGTRNDTENEFLKRTPYMYAGSKYCPHCGVRMVKPNE